MTVRTRNSKLKTQNSVKVAAGLIFRDGKLLITRRQPDAHLGGLWEFPGGKREPGETFKNCLVRELREELGIEVEIRDVLASLTHAYPERTVHLKFFRCRWRENEPRPLGCPEFRWVSLEELKEYAFPAADSRVLEILQRSSELWR